MARREPDHPESAEDLRERIIGFGERSGRKSFYPELKERLSALEFLSRASVRLASSLDVGGTLQNLVELAIPSLGDFCAICSWTRDASRGHGGLPTRQDAVAMIRRRLCLSTERDAEVADALGDRLREEEGGWSAGPATQSVVTLWWDAAAPR
jgi:hypothetical protein